MAHEIVYGKLICKCERCPKVWMAKTIDLPMTCTGCRSKLWDVPKKIEERDKETFKDATKSGTMYFNDVKPARLIETPEELKLLNDRKTSIEMGRIATKGNLREKAIACAVLLNFKCDSYTQKDPTTPLCETCFKLEVWDRPNVIMNLLEAFKEEEFPATVPCDLVDATDEKGGEVTFSFTKPQQVIDNIKFKRVND